MFSDAYVQSVPRDDEAWSESLPEIIADTDRQIWHLVVERGVSSGQILLGLQSGLLWHHCGLASTAGGSIGKKPGGLRHASMLVGPQGGDVGDFRTSLTCRFRECRILRL